MSIVSRKIVSQGRSYEVLRKLGEGYAGEVFEVRDVASDMILALKLLKKEAFAEGQLVAFKREFGALTAFHHPHICRVYDFGFAESDKRYFFTVELVHGEGLYVCSDRLSFEEVEVLFVQIVDALGFIHSAGFIHFDIKGSNILVTETTGGRLAKIVDFGLAAPPVDAPSEIVGTIRYMSPEMITKLEAIDYRADLYSLGIVLYRMLAHRYPPQGATMAEIFAWHVRHEALDLTLLKEKGVPQYLVDIVEKLLQPIPSERFSSAPVIIRYIELHSGRRYAKSQRALLATLAEEGPLVGRSSATYQIRSALRRISQVDAGNVDAPQVLVLSGSHGMGKSRLLKEARYLAQLAQLRIFVIRGREDGQDLNEMRKVFGFAKLTDDIEMAINKTVADILAQQNLTILIDDLDCCCQAVRDVFVGVSGSLYVSRIAGRPLPLLMLATVGSDGASAGREQTFSGAHIEVLRPLSPDDIAQYIESFLGEHHPTQKQIEDLYQYSAGVPELVRIAVASLEAPGSSPMRDTKVFFAERIEMLSGTARVVLGALSIAGRQLGEGQLENLVKTKIEDALAELIRVGFIRFDRSADTFELAAKAVETPAIEALKFEEKKSIASILLDMEMQKSFPDFDAALMFAQICASEERICDLILKAADHKEELKDLAGAAGLLSQVLVLMEDKDERLPSIHRRLSRHLILIGKYDEAISHIDKASCLTSVSIEDLTSLSWLNRLQHKPDVALRNIERALVLLGSGPDDFRKLRLLNEAALCYLQMGDIEEAVRIFQDSDERSHRLPKDEQDFVLNNNLGMALVRAGRYSEAISFYLEKYDRVSGDKRIASSALAQLAFAYEQAGFQDKALDTYRKSWDLASEVGDIHSGAVILSNIINICQQKALFSDALRYAEESLSIASRAASKKDIAATFFIIGNLYINLGLEDIAPRYLNEAASSFEQLGDTRMLSWVRLSTAHLYNNLGKVHEARCLIDEVIKQAQVMGDDDLLFWSRCGAVEIFLDAGDLDTAALHIDNLDFKLSPKEFREKEITAGFLKLKCDVLRGKAAESIAMQLNELADVSLKRGCRELGGEICHLLGIFYRNVGDDMRSATAFTRAMEIYSDIASTLSEEYRDSFLRQKSRKAVFDDSVKLDRFSPAVSEAVAQAVKAKEEVLVDDKTSKLSEEREVESYTKSISRK